MFLPTGDRTHPADMVRAAVAAEDALAERFNALARATGWRRTVWVERRPVLVNARKVHLCVDCTRDRADGSVIARRRNLWIATEDGGRSGTKQRSDRHAPGHHA